MTISPGPTPSGHNLPFGLLLGLIGVIIFGGTLPMMRLAVFDLDVAFVTAGRAFVAGLLAIFLLAVIKTRRPSRQEVGTLLAIALTLVAGFPFFAALAMVHAPASHGGIVLGILPLSTAIVSTIVTGERPSMGFWLCAVLGAGIVLAATLRSVSGGLTIGDLSLLAAVVSASIGYVLSGQLSRTMPGWAVVSWALVFSMPVVIPFTWIYFPTDLSLVSNTSWAAFIYLALMSQFVGFFAWNKGLALGGIARVSQTQLLQTFVTLALAALLLGEAIDAQTIGFAVAVVVVVGIGLKMRVRP